MKDKKRIKLRGSIFKVDINNREIKLFYNNFEIIKVLEKNRFIIKSKNPKIIQKLKGEEEEIFDNIKREYLYNRYGDCTIREFSKVQKQIEEDKEMYYDALVDYNKRMRFKKRLLRFVDSNVITLDQFNKALVALCDAKTDEEFNSILAKAKDN